MWIPRLVDQRRLPLSLRRGAGIAGAPGMAHPVDGQAQGAQAGPSSYIVIFRAAESPLSLPGRGRGVKKCQLQ